MFTILYKEGWEVLTAENGTKGLEEIKGQTKKIDVILLDLMMPGMSGMEVLDHVRTISGQGKLAMPHREKAIAGRYPQALLVNGFLYLTGQNENPQDVCKAGELMRESAIEGRLAGLLGFPRYAMQGTFAGCTVKQDRAELLAFLEAARQQVAGDFYRTMLVDLLREDLLASKTIR